jgi:hypothetical protein
MFQSISGISQKFAWRIAAIVSAAAMSALFGGCAHTAPETPALQWQMSTAEAQQEGRAYVAQKTETTPASACAGDVCYLYRGGRDPKSGLAYTQL